eukprot:2793227-Rhodomonas_salina.5
MSITDGPDEQREDDADDRTLLLHQRAHDDALLQDHQPGSIIQMLRDRSHEDAKSKTITRSARKLGTRNLNHDAGSHL